MLVASFAGLDAQGQQFLKRANELRAGYRRFYTATLGHRARSTEAFESFVDRPWSVYFEPTVDFADVKGDENASGFNLTRLGVVAGADRRLNDHLFVGGTLGYASTTADLSDGGQLDASTFNVNGYLTWFDGGLHFEGMIGGAFNSFDTERAAIEGIAHGSADGFAWTGLIGGGYDWENGPWKFGPQVALQYKSAQIGGFTESGSLSPLRIESQSETALHSQMGGVLRHRYHVPATWTVISPEIYFGWRHEFMADQFSLDSTFASGAGDTFTVDGPALGSDSIVFSFGVSVQWKPTVNTFINFTREMGRSGYAAQNINAAVRFSF
jgi:outer membrane autotransporter protein